MPKFKNDIENSNLLGQDAKCVIFHILGWRESKKALNILKDFRADIALKDIFDFAGNKSLYVADNFSEYKKIFDFIAAESPVFSRYTQEAVECANRGKELSQIILPHFLKKHTQFNPEQIGAMIDGWCYENKLRTEIVVDYISYDKNPKKSAKIIGSALSRISYKQTNPLVKAVTEAFMNKYAKDSVCLDIFTENLLAPSGTVSNQHLNEKSEEEFKREICKNADVNVQKMVFFALDGKNAGKVRQIYHDDFFSSSAQKAIKLVCALTDKYPEFLPVSAKILQSVAEESIKQKRRGVFVYLSAEIFKRPALAEKLLPFYEGAGKLSFEHVGMLFFTALKTPALKSRIMKILKESVRTTAFSSKEPLFNLNPVCHILQPDNIQTPEAFELIYTYLNDAVSDMNQMHVFCKNCLDKLGPNDTGRPEIFNIIRTMHRNKMLRSNPKDFSLFMADLESFRIENAYHGPLNDYINGLKEKTPLKLTVYIGQILKNSLDYKKRFGHFKRKFSTLTDIDDDYVCRQPEKHQRMTLNEAGKQLNNARLTLLEKTKIFLQLKKFEYLALPENREYCREVAKSLSLNPFYAKSVAFAKFNILDGGKQTLRKVWNKNER